jgi:hypothetical protein
MVAAYRLKSCAGDAGNLGSPKIKADKGVEIRIYRIEIMICYLGLLSVSYCFMISRCQRTAQSCCRCTCNVCASFGGGKLGM